MGDLPAPVAGGAGGHRSAVRRQKAHGSDKANMASVEDLRLDLGHPVIAVLFGWSRLHRDVLRAGGGCGNCRSGAGQKTPAGGSLTITLSQATRTFALEREFPV